MFENTDLALKQCIEEGEEYSQLSKSEQLAFMRLYDRCHEFWVSNEHLVEGHDEEG